MQNEVNLKLALMQLGNKLVLEHRFSPAASSDNSIIWRASEKDTRVIAWLTDFINHHPEAQQVLKELGFAWPLAERSHGKID